MKRNGNGWSDQLITRGSIHGKIGIIWTRARTRCGEKISPSGRLLCSIQCCNGARRRAVSRLGSGIDKVVKFSQMCFVSRPSVVFLGMFS